MNKKKLIIGIVGVLVVAGGIWFFTGKTSKGGIRLQTAKEGRSSISNTVTATGTVEPVTEVEVGTQVSGIIDKLYADYNDVVKAGQLIAEMDKVNLKAELASAEAQLASSKSEFEYQQKNYARNKILFEKKLISDSDYETSTYNYEKAKAAYEQNQAAMVKVNRNLEYATITSPIDGVVINRAVEEGQTVAAGFETPTLFTIAADLTKMQVIADVDEADIGNVENGQRVSFTVDAYPNDVFEGTVMQIRLGDSESTSSSSSTSTSTVVTYEVVISADNPDLRANAMIRYAAGLRNSFGRCWALTQYFASEDSRSGFNYRFNSSWARKAYTKADRLVVRALREFKSPELAAQAHLKLKNFKTVVRDYPHTRAARLVHQQCDRYYDYAIHKF